MKLSTIIMFVFITLGAIIPFFANDTSTIVIQNNTNHYIEVLIQMHPPTGCRYVAHVITPDGKLLHIKNVCKYPGVNGQGTMTYHLNPWPGVDPATMRFNVFIEDGKDHLLGFKRNVRGGIKLEFPRSFDLGPLTIPVAPPAPVAPVIPPAIATPVVSPSATPTVAAPAQGKP
jgi:hypothetical protein